MTVCGARSMLALLAALEACHQSAASRTVGPSPAFAPSVQSAPSHYPPSYPVFEEAELRRREGEAAKRNPGWVVTLLPVGLLASAELAPDGLKHRFGEDEQRVVDFLTNNVDLIGGEVSRMKLLPSNGLDINYDQIVAETHVASVRVDFMKRPRISGHFWPSFEEPRILVPEPAARQVLETADPWLRGMVLKHTPRLVAHGPAGPVEVHLCLELDHPLNKRGRCLDPATGEVIASSASFLVTRTTRYGMSEVTHDLQIDQK